MSLCCSSKITQKMIIDMNGIFEYIFIEKKKLI